MDMSFVKYLHIGMALSFWMMFTYLGWYPNDACKYYIFSTSAKSIAFQIPSLVMSGLAYGRSAHRQW